MAHANSECTHTRERSTQRKCDTTISPRVQAMHPVLSPAWAEMADKLFRIANISEMEKKLARTKAVETKGSSGETTLWEGEELALRYVLEDGKLNLCVRLVEEYQGMLLALDAEAKALEVRMHDFSLYRLAHTEKSNVSNCASEL